MGLFVKSGEKIKEKAEKEIKAWLPPEGNNAKNINIVDMCYIFIVVVVGLLILGQMDGKGLPVLILMFCIVIAISKSVRHSAIKELYNIVAPKFKSWVPDYDQAIAADYRQAELKKAAALNPGITDVPFAEMPSAASTALSNESRDAISTWLAMSQTEKRQMALAVVKFVKTNDPKENYEMLDIASEDAKDVISETILTSISNKYTLRPVAIEPVS